eukprot:scaffold1514_cov171-Skeletonema_menzelii.AAC.1
MHGCGDSYHTDGYFKQSQSTTFRELTCDECFQGSCASMLGGKKCKVKMSYFDRSIAVDWFDGGSGAQCGSIDPVRWHHGRGEEKDFDRTKISISTDRTREGAMTQGE